MPTAENAQVLYEAGQDLVAMVALTDDGDHKNFNSADELMSNRSGYEPDVKPNGLATGGAVTPADSGSNDVVDVAALTCYLAGVNTPVSASADEAITRATPADTHIINSITVTAAGAIAVIAGTDSTAFSETRGAAGGPPWIPTGSVEIAQVRLASSTAAAITADEIKQVINTHQERYDYPTWSQERVRVANQVIGVAGVDFATAMPLIHSDDAGSTTATKKVYAKYYTPSFAAVPEAEGFVPPESTHSTSSTQIYGKTKGSISSSLGQGSFTAHLQDGISDGLLTLKNETLWFKFKQDKLKAPYILCQGKLGISRSFPAGDSITASCSVSAEEAAVEVVS